MSTVAIAAEVIENSIFLIRQQKVMVDRDLARLYGVETKYLNRQVKRNVERFPGEFMFQLTVEEKQQLVTICHRFEPLKHSVSLPYVFTEHGVAMLASVLRSQTAVEMSIVIIKTFIKLREVIATNKKVFEKLMQIEQKLGRHDEEIKVIFDALRQLMAPPVAPEKRKIGFHGE